MERLEIVQRSSSAWPLVLGAHVVVFLRMPFGLKNAAQAFQRFTDEVCRGLEFFFVYIDNTVEP